MSCLSGLGEVEWTGTYDGSVPLVIDILFTFASATSANMDINVKVANREIKCPAEAIAVTETTVTFPNAEIPGDCMGDAPRGQKKDPSKYSLTINSDGPPCSHSKTFVAIPPPKPQNTRHPSRTLTSKWIPVHITASLVRHSHGNNQCDMR